MGITIVSSSQVSAWASRWRARVASLLLAVVCAGLAACSDTKKRQVTADQVVRAVAIGKAADACVASGRAPEAWTFSDRYYIEVGLKKRTHLLIGSDVLLPHHGFRRFAVIDDSAVFLVTYQGQVDTATVYGPFDQEPTCPPP